MRRRGLPEASVTPERIDREELKQFREDFLRVVRKASQQKSRSGNWNWIKHRRLVLAFSSLLVFVLLLATTIRYSSYRLEAAPIQGIQGVVINGATGRSMSGVIVTSYDDQGNGEIQDLSDAAGFFDIPAANGKEVRSLHFEFQGRELATLLTGESQDAVSGFVRVVVPGPRTENATSKEVELGPGQVAELGSEVILKLDESAASNWSGRLVHDPNWPSVFNYGRVFDGIFLADGPAAAGLSFSVRVPGRKLEFCDATAQDIQLLAHNSRYASEDEYRAFHRGWYLAENPPQAYLPQLELCRHSADGFTEFKWSAEPGVQFALLLPPVKEGKLDAIEFYDFDSMRDPWLSRLVHHYDLSRSQLGLYRLFHQPSAQEGPWELSLQPTTHRLRHSLADVTWHAEDGARLEPLCPDGEACHVPGSLWAEMFDFTMQNQVVFSDITVDLPLRKNPYTLEFSIGEIGNSAELEITGASQLPPRAVAWDFTDDGVVDAWGHHARIPILYSGSSRVAVYVEEPGGNTVKLAKKLQVPGPNEIGWYWEQPIMLGSDSQPEQQASHMAMTYGMVANPQPYGYSTGLFIPQVLLIDIPERMAEVPLKELRIHIFGTPQAGDFDKVYLAGHFMPIASADYQRLKQPESDESFYQNPADFFGLDCASVSFVVENALKRASAGGAWLEYLAGQGQIGPVAQGFEIFLGLDLANLPPAPEVLQALGQFQRDPRYAIRYLTEPGQELVWNIDLRGGAVRPGGGIIVGVSMETKGLLYNCQWLMHSGGKTPARIEIESESGEILTQYLDYSQLH